MTRLLRLLAVLNAALAYHTRPRYDAGTSTEILTRRTSMRVTFTKTFED